LGAKVRTAVTVIVSFLAGWYLLALIVSPTESDFEEATAAHYFETISREVSSPIARYQDCRVVPAEPSDRAQGIARMGLCSSEDAEFRYSYFVALSVTANVRYSGFDRFPK
jgi:hypothetical protein